MHKKLSIDWWRYELYRHIAHYLHDPADHTEAKLITLIAEFRHYSEREQPGYGSDEHEHVMNYC